ncbi:MAG: uroporphyrinogen-III synthase [Dysgonamonadaceae bacterium]|jgi:uroporphyrinogen-III synthase|nr:uroporphyrinogen-III synthase [Dysgonamonadaceae bacterium]
MDLKIKKILVSQPKPTTEKSPYYDIAEKYGVEVVFRPFIKVEALSAKEFRSQRVNILDYSAVIFTAKTAIDCFFKIAEEMRIQIPETMKYFCVSESIAVYLQKYIIYRKRKIFFSATGKIEELMIPINKHNKETFCVPVSDVHKEDLLHLLDMKKIKYTKVTMYRTVSNDFTPEEKFDYDLLLFFSPQGVASLIKNFPDLKQDDVVIGSFGPTTAKAVKDAGLNLDIEAPNENAPSMTAALDNFLRSVSKNEQQ